MKRRNYYQKIWEEFSQDKSMVLISGPRQSGKTTLAQSIAGEMDSSLYFNYDIPADKSRLLKNPAFFEEMDRKPEISPLVILDEIHKYADWKNYLKGIYDGYSNDFHFLVTGSGRLDLSSKKGDSLAGRYLHFHLYPFTLGEIFSTSIGIASQEFLQNFPDANPQAAEVWETMFQVSGFPEPFLQGTKQKYRRWTQAYHRQIIRDDIRDEFAVKQLDNMENLYFLLSESVGSPFSASSLARILKVAPKTISSWVEVFERFFLTFTLPPYSKRIARSLVKERKIYFYDYCRIQEDSLRFENMIALELDRATTLWNDFGLGDFQLWYLRNKEKEEVDFLVTDSGKPQFMVEAKLTQTDISPHLIKFQNQLNIPAFQLVNKSNVSRKIRNGSNNLFVLSAADWLCHLN